MKNIYKFLLSLIICYSAAAIGGMFTATSVSSWYAHLIKPAISPPNWLFAPVWNVLYFLMAVSLYFVLVSGKQKYQSLAMKAFSFQLILNIAWSAVFFGLQSPLGGLIVIAFLLMAIIAQIFIFGYLSRPASFLLIPYFVWVCFASYLNYQLYVLNQ